jgi:hypothetical protein
MYIYSDFCTLTIIFILAAYGHVECYSWKIFFLEYFEKRGISKSVLSQIEWDSWLEKPGMPPYTPVFNKEHSAKAIKLAQLWLDADNGSDVVNLYDADRHGLFPSSTSERIIFLEHLEEGHKSKPLSLGIMKRIDKVHSLTASTNAEIQFLWYKLSIKTGYTAAFDATIKFLTSQVSYICFYKLLKKKL